MSQFARLRSLGGCLGGSSGAPNLSFAVARLTLLVCLVSLIVPNFAPLFFQFKLFSPNEIAYQATLIPSITSDSSTEEAWIVRKAKPVRRARLLRAAVALQNASSQSQYSLPQPELIIADNNLLAPAKIGGQLITHKVSQGDNIEQIWKKYGASRKSALLAANVLTQNGVKLDRFKLGEALLLEVSEKNQITRFEKRLTPSSSIIIELAEDGRYHKVSEGNSTQLPQNKGILPTVLPTTTGNLAVPQPAANQDVKKESSARLAPGTISGKIESSFFAAAKKSGLSLSLVDDVVDLFSDRIDFRKDLQPGDTFVVQFADGSSAGSVISAASFVNHGKLYAAVRHQGKSSKPIFFNEAGEPIGDFFLRYPVQFTRVSSVFSDGRLHPVLGIRRPHLGVDFAAPTGTPVRAVASGRVVSAGYDRERGYNIKIAHDNRFATAYLHLSKIQAAVKTGSTVDRGDVIGAVGMTGLATGPHLHFGLFDNGRYIDPMNARLPLLEHGMDQIPAGKLQLVMKSLELAHHQIAPQVVLVAQNIAVTPEQPKKRRA